MPKRSLIDLMTLRLAFERSGRVLPVDEPASPPLPPEPPADEPAPEADEPNRGRLEWVARPHGLPVQRRIDSDYNPFSPERLR